MPDPQFPLHCPKCGKPVVYVRTEGDTHFYRCDRDGSVVFPPHGRIYVENPTTPVTLH